MCDWCHQVHPGNSANCYDPDADEQAKIFSGDTAETEQLCWDVFNRVREITTYIKEKMMIPNYEAPEPQQGNTRGGGRGRQTANSGFPYLNQTNQSEYLSTDGSVRVKILDCRIVAKPSWNQSPITLKIAIRGRVVLWGVRTTNQNLPILVEMFGRDENNWAEKEFMFSLEEDEFTGKIWPHVEPLEKKATAKKKAGSE